MTKLYLDTCIIINAIKEENNLFGKSMSKPASKLVLQAALCKYFLIISSHTLFELAKKCKDTTIFFKTIKKKTIKIDQTEEDQKRAKSLKPNNYPDALHIVLAEKSNADYLVTRNTKHFNEIETNIPIKIPEQLI